MLSSRTIIANKARRLTTSTNNTSSSIRSLSILTSRSSPLASSSASSSFKHQHNHQYQQQRTLLGLVHAIDKRVYRWAKGVLPPISKTENIALGCGTIGEYYFDYQWLIVQYKMFFLLLLFLFCNSTHSFIFTHNFFILQFLSLNYYYFSL